jgi:propionyl-CoA synthetase
MVRSEIGAVASFKNAILVNQLPKTRSGKILRGVIQAIADGKEPKVPGTIEDYKTIEEVTKSLRDSGFPHSN